MRKILMIVVVCLLLIGGVLWYREKQAKQQSQGGGLLGGAVQVSGQAASNLRSDSAIRKLSNDVSLALTLSPADFDPLIQSLSSFGQRLSATNLWKTFNPQGSIADLIRMRFASGSENFEDNEKMAMRVLQLLQQSWAAMSELTVAASRSSVKLKEDREIPHLLVSASFKSSDAPGKLFKMVSGLIPPEQTSIKGDDFELTRLSPNEKSFRFATSLQDGTPISMLVEFGDKNLQAFVGDGAREAFFNPQATPLVSSPEFTSVGQAVLPGSAVVLYFDAKALGSLTKNAIANSLQGLPAPELEKINRMFKSVEYGSALWSANFNDGFNGRQCMKLDPNSPTGQIYQKGLASAGTGLTPATRRIVNERTMLAGAISANLASLFLGSVRQTYMPEAAVQGQPNAAEWQRFGDQLQAVEKALSDLKLKELGLAVNAPTGGAFMPEAALYFTSNEPVALKTFTETLNGLLKVLGKESAPVQAVLASDPSGGDRIEIGLPGQPPIKGVKVDDRTVVFSTSDALFQIASAPAGSYLEAAASKRANLSAQLGKADTYYYLSTRALINAVKPFAPMLLMQMPNANIQPQDIDEIANLLSFDAVSLGSSSYSDGGLVCTDGRSLFLQ